MSISLEQLQRKGKLNAAPGDFPLKSWLEVARGAISTAETYEAAGNDEGAYVEWRKWAQVLEAILKHPMYDKSRKAKDADYMAFQDLKARFGHALQHTKALETKLKQRDAAAIKPAAVINGHHPDPVLSPSTSSTFASPPTSPPMPSSQPILPDSPKRGRPISGGLASRMAALQVAGLDAQPLQPVVQPATPTKPPSPRMQPAAQLPGPSRTPPPPAQMNGAAHESVKPRRPLPPTPHGPSAVPAANGSEMPLPAFRAPSPAIGLSRPASAPVIEGPAAESILSSPQAPEPQRFHALPHLGSQATGFAPDGNPFPSLLEFDSRFPSVPNSAPSGLSTMAAQSEGALKRSPKLGSLHSGHDQTAFAEPAPRLAVDIPQSSYSRDLPRTNYILPDALWEYLQPPLQDQPTLLLLDVRHRDDFVRGHIEAPFCLCVEPITLPDGVASNRLEASLVISPAKERDAFLSRDQFDLVVMYDQASSNIPPRQPGPSTTDASRYLYNLYTAIFEREYHRPLRRPPVILVGGFEAWQKFLKTKSDGVAEASARLEGGGRPRQGTSSSIDAKRSNRRAMVAPGEEIAYDKPGVSRSIVDLLSNSSYSNANGQTGPIHRSHSGFATGSPIASPPIAAMPPLITRQSSGPINSSYASYDPGFAAHAPRQRSTIDYPALQSIPQRPPVAAQANGPPPRPAPMTHQVQRLSSANFSADGQDGESPLTPLSGASQLSQLVKWGDGTVGFTGLKNLGNTCYMNSTLQCLSATVPLARFFKDGSYKRAINRSNPLGTRGALVETVAQLFGVLWSEQYNFVSPVTFRDAICRFAPQFSGTDQHDSQEFLAFLLDGLHEDLNFVQQKPAPIPYTQEREAQLEMLPPQIGGEREWGISLRRENSVVVAWFQGQYRSQLRCLTCNKTSTTYNNFQYLTLALPSQRLMGSNKVKLEDLLSAYVQEETLDKDDAWNCPRCKVPRKATKQLTLVRLPPVLIIHLKRFQFKGPFSDKIDTPVIFPLYGLDMQPYLPPPLAPAVQAQYAKVAPDFVPSRPESSQYDLYAVSEQIGTLSSGHYTAKARSRDQWFEIGDSKVRRCEEHDVRKSVKTAYILFYRRR